MTAPVMRPARPEPMARGGGALRVPALAALAAAGAVGVVAVIDPNQPGHYPTCPFLALTGMYCPGCGALRAVHDLAHGDLGGAMARNPLVVIVVGAALLGYAAWVRQRWLGQPRQWSVPRWLVVALVVSYVGFGVLRNLPGWTWLSPA